MKNDFSNIGQINSDFFSDEIINESKVFVTLFNSIPNERIKKGDYDIIKIKKFIKDKFSLENKQGQIRCFHVELKKNPDDDDDDMIYHDRRQQSGYLIIIESGFMISLNDKSFISFYSDKIEEKRIIQLEKDISKFTKKENKKKSCFHMIVKGYDSFELNEYKVRQTKTNIDLHYNDDFKSFDEDVVSFLKDKQRNGMILMHGESGTGKTTYIRHLIQNLNLKFIFLPLFMAESLSSPELLPFLSEQKNSILIIEDSEKLIRSHESGNAQNDIATLLNISDGLLSDALGIKLICTFNTGLESIDKALLRKGRMINRYEFKKLSIDKAAKLAKKHKLPYNEKQQITLGDLFNIDKANVTGEFERKGIGF